MLIELGVRTRLTNSRVLAPLRSGGERAAWLRPPRKDIQELPEVAAGNVDPESSPRLLPASPFFGTKLLVSISCRSEHSTRGIVRLTDAAKSLQKETYSKYI